MSPATVDDYASAAERKRMRDRRAQQKLRERREAQMKELAQQVLHCQRSHGSANVWLLTEKMQDLEQRNKILLEERDNALAAATALKQHLDDLIACFGNHRPVSAADSAVHLEALPTQLPAMNPSIVDLPESRLLPGQSEMPSGDVANGVGTYLSEPTSTISQHSSSPLVNPQSRHQSHETNARSSVEQSLPMNDGDQRIWTSGHSPHEPMFRESGVLKAVAPSHNHPIVRNHDNELDFPPSRTHATPEFSEPRWRGDPEPLIVDSAVEMPSCGSHSPQDKTPTTVTSPSPHEWSLLPRNTIEFDCRLQNCTWLAFPHAVAAAPESPDPEDLLFGSRKNFLANEIHKGLRKARVAETERLAMGWLLYVFSKWRILPSQENYERLPSFFRPSPRQVREPHPASFDTILFPELRHNLMDNIDNPNLEQALDLLACCIKVRWTWGQEILQTNNDNTRVIRDDFYQTFNRLDGWGITLDFIQLYPDFLGGFDLDDIVYVVS